MKHSQGSNEASSPLGKAGSPTRTRGAALALLLAGCAAVPDELELTYGRGWGDIGGSGSLRDIDQDAQTGTIGLTWYLSKPADRLPERVEVVWPKTPQEAPGAPPATDPAKTDDDPTAEILGALGGLAVALTAWVKRGVIVKTVKRLKPKKETPDA